MLACRALGHRYRFRADGSTMTWECARACGAGGSKQYASPAEATRYAQALEDERTAEGRMPLVAALPLRLIRRLVRSRPSA